MITSQDTPSKNPGLDEQGAVTQARWATAFFRQWNDIKAGRIATPQGEIKPANPRNKSLAAELGERRLAAFREVLRGCAPVKSLTCQECVSQYER